ncbi:hypothetical protein KIPB_001800 [Kipferlia bialata]|uniref:Protein kinase domain-containing protein n=1 Tax=Kipferlia bialata TaxID=797122 RepID=A0A9K3CRH6_9EUKA|nr:hypothetical protein KIPB_001800 [Kipferlia bialata]|eukprot:g1800.t1
MTKATKFHSSVVRGTVFDVPEHYEVIKSSGQGSYGVVAQAKDTRRSSNSRVAIKKILNLFSPHLLDTKRNLREVAILNYLSHENVIKLIEIIPPQDKAAFDDIYVVYDYMQTDMHKVIVSKQSLSDEHIRFFAYQLVRGLKYLHSAGVVHRDLKPSNLLLNANCDLKICDFGLARLARTDEVEESKDAAMTGYVATRWYRAPEIILGDESYGYPVDVWSVGCIIAELIERRPLLPGKDYLRQLHMIFDLLGTPEPEDIKHICSDRAYRYVQSMPKRAGTGIKKRLGLESDSPALDLISKMLKFHPTERITAEEALRHPYFADLHDPTDEPGYVGSPISLPFEAEELTEANLRRSFLTEVAKNRQRHQ